MRFSRAYSDRKYDEAWPTELFILVGRIILGVELIKGDDEFLRFDTPEGPVYFQVHGDCCSQSWVEHLTVPDDISGATVIGAEAKDLHDKTIDSHPEHDCLQFYEESVRTNKGDIIIEFRNSSNGYYGGDLLLVEPIDQKKN